MSRLELVPISVAEPASVVACATGSNTPRAGMPDRCSSSFVAGINMAMIGVVLISPDSTPHRGDQPDQGLPDRIHPGQQPVHHPRDHPGVEHALWRDPPASRQR